VRNVNALNCTHIQGAYTQFCITRRQDSSPEEPKMRENSWRPGLCPGPHSRSLHNTHYTAIPQAPSWWGGAVSPLSKNPEPLAQPFGLRVLVLWDPLRNVDFVPTPLHPVWSVAAYGITSVH